MKRFYILTVLLCLAIISMAQTTFVYNTDTHDLIQTKDGITVTIAQGSGQTAPKWNQSWNEDYTPSDMRLYLGNTITVTSSTELKDIKMVFAKSAASNKDYTGLSANTGSLVSGGSSTANDDWKVDTWTGSAQSVTFTLTGKGQRRIYSLVVNGEALLPDIPEEKPLPTEADLVSEYTYAEPTIVGVPDTTIVKKEYAFIDNNILVHCETGSIVKAKAADPDDEESVDEPAYFNCNADYSISFTASQEIKGIAISGFVRKAFTASCDHGDITYLTNADYDMEGWPALVITNVNSKSVTLSCPRQLRCYQLAVYFNQNPDPIDMTTSVNPVSHEAAGIKATKVLLNGQLYIRRNTSLITLTGQEVEP